MSRKFGRKVGLGALALLAILLLGASLVSLSDSDQGLVRAVDLVRQPIAYLAALLAILAIWLRGRAGFIIAGLLGIVVLIQLVRLWPYLPMAEEQLALTDDDDAGECVSALALNVKQSNRQFDRVAELIGRTEPDIVLLMETDPRWAEALDPALSAYQHRLSMPLDNTYGMMFASKIDTLKAKMIANTSADTPTLYATLRLPNASAFEFIGLHPRPPLPGEDTTKRDANIARAGAVTPDRLADVVVMGDFNDVPWSTTTTRFREDGDYRDPRAGRGTYPTFPAGMTFVGWPLDQIMVKNEIRLQSFEVLDDVGADHRPMLARFCLRDGEGTVIESFTPDADAVPLEAAS